MWGYRIFHCESPLEFIIQLCTYLYIIITTLSSESLSKTSSSLTKIVISGFLCPSLFITQWSLLALIYYSEAVFFLCMIFCHIDMEWIVYIHDSSSHNLLTPLPSYMCVSATSLPVNLPIEILFNSLKAEFWLGIGGAAFGYQCLHKTYPCIHCLDVKEGGNYTECVDVAASPNIFWFSWYGKYLHRIYW